MIDLRHGHVLDILAELAAASVQTIVTSPPYWRLRRYTDDPREIGQEATYQEYVKILAGVFDACWRVLRDDGTLFLNLGDSYVSSARHARLYGTADKEAQDCQVNDRSFQSLCDEHTDAVLRRILDSDDCHVVRQVVLLLGQIQEHMGVLSCHVPSEDLMDRSAPGQSLLAMLDLGQTVARAAVPPLSELLSKIVESSALPPVARMQADMLSACLSSLRSFSSCARRFAHMTAELLRTRDCSPDIASLYEELTDHIQCTAACCSFVLSWLNPPYIQPQYTAFGSKKQATGLPPKSLIGLPWRVAFALQDRGWVLRNEIIWHKPNAMPSPHEDRLTSSHEHLFLFAKQSHYYFDLDPIREPHTTPGAEHNDPSARKDAQQTRNAGGRIDGYTRVNRPKNYYGHALGKNPRTVWSINTRGLKDEHYAAMPDELPRRCILAGSRPGDTVLDPFVGSGTTCRVAEQLGRHSVGIDLVYQELQERRTDNLQIAMEAYL